jgi:hypothetical protein
VTEERALLHVVPPRLQQTSNGRSAQAAPSETGERRDTPDAMPHSAESATAKASGSAQWRSYTVRTKALILTKMLELRRSTSIWMWNAAPSWHLGRCVIAESHDRLVGDRIALAITPRLATSRRSPQLFERLQSAVVTNRQNTVRSKFQFESRLPVEIS